MLEPAHVDPKNCALVAEDNAALRLLLVTTLATRAIASRRPRTGTKLSSLSARRARKRPLRRYRRLPESLPSMDFRCSMNCPRGDRIRRSS
jgi:hypothetical protein